MKRTFIALFLFCILALASGQSPKKEELAQDSTETRSANPGSTCSYSNAFIQYLKRSGVTFFSEPDYNNKSCGDEWSNYGSCCDANSLKNFYANQQYEMRQLIRRAIKRVYDIKTVIYRQERIIQLAIVILKKRVNGMEVLNKNIKRKLVHLLSELRRFNHIGTGRALKWIHKYSVKMVISQKSCLENILDVRSDGLCYACSGRASSYFSSGRLNMHEDQCRGTISRCSGSWVYLLGFLNRVSRFYQASIRLQAKMGINFNRAMSNSPATYILNWVKEANLLRKLVKCKKGYCDFKTAKEICEGFISFDKPVYLNQALRIVRSIISNIGKTKGKVIKKKLRANKVVVTEKYYQLVRKDTKKALKYYKELDLKIILTSLSRFLPIQDRKELLSILKSTEENGRVLILSAKKTLPRVEKPQLAVIQPEATPAPQTTLNGDSTSTTRDSPLLCDAQQQVCETDKVVVSASVCSLMSGIFCTNPEIIFP